MGTLKVPDNITSITIGGVALVPSVDHFVVVTADQATGIIPQQSQPKLMGTDLLGNATVKLPPSITAISFAGVAYVGDGQNQITLPPAVVTQFLGAESWHPFWHFDPSGGMSVPPITFNPDDPILPQNPVVDTPFDLDISGHFQNGVPPILYSIFSGGLPPGLALNPGTGHVTGTPTTPGNSGNVVFKGQDSKGNSANSNGVPFNTAAAFNPADVFVGGFTGGFWDFTDPATLWSDAARTIPATLNGPIRGVTDKSGNGRHLSTASATLLMRNGYVEFPGNVVGFTSAAGPVGSASGWSSAAAMAPDNSAMSSWIDSDLGSARIAQMLVTGNQDIRSSPFVGGVQDAVGQGYFPGGTTQVALSTAAANLCTVRVDGAQVVTKSYVGSPAQSASAMIGVGSAWGGLSSQDTWKAAGRLGVALHVNKVLSASEITKLETWLAARKPPAKVALDPFTAGLWSCAGMKRLLTSWTGNALLRVRRSSDNAEIDVGHNAGGVLNIAALVAWAGSSSVFLVRMYDQTGNGRHIEQTIVATQPRVVNAGVYDNTTFFDAVNDVLVTNSAMPGGSAAFSIAMNYLLRAGGTNQVTWCQVGVNSVGHNAGTCQFQGAADSRLVIYMFTGTGPLRSGAYGPLPSPMRTELAVLNRAQIGLDQIRFYRSGAFVSATNDTPNNQTGTFTAEAVTIGGDPTNASPSTMNLNWLALWTTAQDGNGGPISSL